MISDPVIIACNDPKEVEKIANDKAEATSIYNAKNYVQCTGHAFEWKDCNCDFPHCPGKPARSRLTYVFHELNDEVDELIFPHLLQMCMCDQETD